MASFTEEVNSWLAKCPLVFNGRLANHKLTSFVEEAIKVKTKSKVENLCTKFQIV